MEEMIDVLNENGIKTGKILSRNEVHKRGLWHRTVVVAIINEKNEILIQKRSHSRDKNPDMWDISVTGHISAGQDSLSAAIRETTEEVSISFDYYIEVRDFRYMFSFRKEQKVNEDYIDREFFDFFVLRKNGLTENDIKIQLSEVQAVKFVNISELNDMRAKKLLVERDECYDVLTDYLFRI